MRICFIQFKPFNETLLVRWKFQRQLETDKNAHSHSSPITLEISGERYDSMTSVIFLFFSCAWNHAHIRKCRDSIIKIAQSINKYKCSLFRACELLITSTTTTSVWDWHESNVLAKCPLMSRTAWFVASANWPTDFKWTNIKSECEPVAPN